MADDYYPNYENEGGEKEKAGTRETALLPKTIFGDKELAVGKVCPFKVTRIFDDEVEVVYATHEEARRALKEKDEDEEPAVDVEIDMMAAGPPRGRPPMGAGMMEG